MAAAILDRLLHHATVLNSMEIATGCVPTESGSEVRKGVVAGTISE